MPKWKFPVVHCLFVHCSSNIRVSSLAWEGGTIATMAVSTAALTSHPSPLQTSGPKFPSFFSGNELRSTLTLTRQVYGDGNAYCLGLQQDLTIPATVLGQQGEGVVRFRPCIDIHKGKVKQIVGSTLRDLPDDGSSGSSASLVTNFESQLSAGEFAKMYKNDGLTGGHVIMLGADPASHAAALEALAVYPGGLQVGGGVNTENAKGYLNAGASHVIVTSFVFRDGKMDEDRLKQLVNMIGKERLVLDLSCRKKAGQYMVVTDRWQCFSDLALSEATLAMLASSADEFLVHGVDVEGMRLGIDDELVRILGKWSSIPVTYAGGVNTLADLERIKVAGAGAVDATVGSALDIFGGDLPYKEVVAWHNRQVPAWK